MKTAKALGFVKGDFVLTEASFPAIIIADVNRTTPMLEVWGVAQEMGSAYAHDLRKIDKGIFMNQARNNGHDINDLKPYSPVSKEALADKA